MTPKAAAQVLDTLLAGYPFTDFSAATLAQWTHAIVRLETDAGRACQIARRWSARDARMPSLAEFITAIRPRPAVTVTKNEWVPPDPAIVKYHLAEARRRLALGKGAT